MMELSTTIPLVIFFLLCEGFFSGSEYLLISFNRIRLRYLAESGDKGAEELERLLKTPENIFGVTSIGTNISVFAGTAIVTTYMAQRMGEMGDIYAIAIMGPVTLVMGEIVPKIFFHQKSELLVRFIAAPLKRSAKLFTPILAVTSFIARFIISNLLRSGGTPSLMLGREELLMMARKKESELNLKHEELKLIDRIFAFGSSNVESVMQPLVNLVAISSTSDIATAKARIAESGYSRLPLFRDRIFNIVGIVSAFDILRSTNSSANVESIMTQTLFVPVSMKSADLLSSMNEKNIHMAVVLDEYGGAVGIVTKEDLLEEIVGEIEDEFDAAVKYYEKRGEGRFIVDSAMELSALKDELGVELPSGDYETISGFMNSALESIPKEKTKIAVGNYLLTVLKATERKITSVLIVDVTATKG